MGTIIFFSQLHTFMHMFSSQHLLQGLHKNTFNFYMNYETVYICVAYSFICSYPNT